MSSLLSSDKVSTTNVTADTIGHKLNSTISHRGSQDACIFDVETNHSSYKLSKIYVKEEDTLPNNTCQLNRISLNFDANQQEYVPIESVRHLLINDIADAQNGNTGNGYIQSIQPSVNAINFIKSLVPRSLYSSEFKSFKENTFNK